MKQIILFKIGNKYNINSYCTQKQYFLLTLSHFHFTK